MILVLALFLAAAPARTTHVRAAHRRPAPQLRAEENPRFGGSAKAFVKAKLAFVMPKDRAELPAGDVEVALRITGYALVGGAHAHLIVDNLPALQIDDASTPLVLRGLEPGAHVLRVVLCRPWHEVVKARHAFAMVRFWSGPRPPGREGSREEASAWPNPRKPLLTYVLPIGEPPRDAPDLELVHAGTTARPPETETHGPTAWMAAEKAKAAASPPLGEDYTPSERPPPPQAKAPPPPPAPPAATPPPARVRPRPLALDFYLSGTHLARGRKGSKVRVVLDKKELQLVRDWKPLRLGRLRPGNHFISIDLLDRLAMKVHNPLNRTDRRFSTP